MASNKTPGYNKRLVIRFSADKNGKPLTHYWSGDFAPNTLGRWIKMSYDGAKLFVAQEQADEVN